MITQRARWFGALVTVPAIITLTTIAAGHETVASRTLPPSQRHLRVLLQGFEMSPRVLDARVGDTITWTNRDIVPHTVTGTKGRWDSGLLNAGAAWSHVVTRGDAGGYICKFHPGMTAVLRVTDISPTRRPKAL